jgi:hypothetical protein
MHLRCLRALSLFFAIIRIFHQLYRVAKELRLLIILIGHRYCIFSKDVRYSL